MKTGVKILLGLLGTAAVGGAVAAVALAGGGGEPVNDQTEPDADENNGEPLPPPQQDEPLVRPGYKVLPKCGGFEITDEVAALKYARDLVGSVPAAGWDEAVALELYGPVCKALPAEEFKALIKVAGGFLYRMTRAVLQGAITNDYYTEPQAEEALKKSRDTLEAMGVAKSELEPTTVWG